MADETSKTLRIFNIVAPPPPLNRKNEFRLHKRCAPFFYCVKQTIKWAYSRAVRAAG